MVMEEAALPDGREYQDRLAEARRKGLPAAAVGGGTMAEQQLHHQVHQARERSRELEQEKQRFQQQVQQLQEQVSQNLNGSNC